MVRKINCCFIRIYQILDLSTCILLAGGMQIYADWMEVLQWGTLYQVYIFVIGSVCGSPVILGVLISLLILPIWFNVFRYNSFGNKSQRKVVYNSILFPSHCFDVMLCISYGMQKVQIVYSILTTSGYFFRNIKLWHIL